MSYKYTKRVSRRPSCCLFWGVCCAVLYYLSYHAVLKLKGYLPITCWLCCQVDSRLYVTERFLCIVIADDLLLCPQRSSKTCRPTQHSRPAIFSWFLILMLSFWFCLLNFSRFLIIDRLVRGKSNFIIINALCICRFYVITLFFLTTASHSGLTIPN